MNRSLVLFGFCLTIAICLQCRNNVIEPPAGHRILIDDNKSNLSDVMTYYDDTELPILPLDSNVVTSGKKTTAHDTVRLKLRARVQSPNVGGVLHCNHVTLDGQFAYVSFHTPEEKYAGAVYVVDISNPPRPLLLCIGKFFDTDITIALRNNSVLYLGEAIDSDHNPFFSSPAVFEEIQLRHGILTTKSRRVDLTGYNGNDIVAAGNKIYITSGTTDGGLTVLNQRNLAILETVSIEGAKACALYNNEIIVMKGTGTTLYFYDKDSYQITRTIELGYPNNLQAKAEVDIVGNRLFLSAWKSGMKVVDLTTNEITHCIRVENNGVCNGVSADGDLAFMANGSEGVYVVKVLPDGLDVLGRIKLDASANYVATRGNMLFVATGEQGFLIIEIIRANNNGNS